MSQSSEVDTLTLPAASADSEAAPDAATLVDSYAEHLMDNLFEDVDRLLDGSEISFAQGSGQLTTVDADSDDSALSTTGADPLDAALQTLDSANVALTPPPQPAKRRRFRLSWEYLLLLGALGSAAAVGVLWAISQQRLSATAPATAGAPAASTEVAQSNPEFLNYLQRSLEVIANRADAGSSPAAGDMPTIATLPNPPLVLPPAPVGASATLGSQAQVNVIERVYIPYQATATPSPVPSAPAAAGTAGSPSQPPNVAAAAVHTLLGVLELGSRSAALFEVNGVPQRIYIGERIGSSGWSLVSVSNEEAIIRRNGEVRSVFIGQKF
jgi:hypothetical protein